MNRALVALAAVLAALAVCIPGAFARVDAGAAPAATPGVTPTSITIGGTFPLSGPASLYAPIPRGMEAYFNWVNNRKGPDGKTYVTDNGNYIYDCRFADGIEDPERLADTLKHRAGIVEHGLFLNIASVVLLAGAERVEERRR